MESKTEIETASAKPREENAREKGVFQTGCGIERGCSFLSGDLGKETARMRELQQEIRFRTETSLYVAHTFKGRISKSAVGQREHQLALLGLSQHVGVRRQGEHEYIHEELTDHRTIKAKGE